MEGEVGSKIGEQVRLIFRRQVVLWKVGRSGKAKDKAFPAGEYPAVVALSPITPKSELDPATHWLVLENDGKSVVGASRVWFFHHPNVLVQPAE